MAQRRRIDYLVPFQVVAVPYISAKLQFAVETRGGSRTREQTSGQISAPCELRSVCRPT